MNEQEFKQLTKELAITALRAVDSLPRTPGGGAVARQLAKCATSVGANYRAACRAKSKADMIAKLAIVEEECDETLFWIEVAVGVGYWSDDQAAALSVPADHILRMTVASIKTLRNRKD